MTYSPSEIVDQIERFRLDIQQAHNAEIERVLLAKLESLPREQWGWVESFIVTPPEYLFSRDVATIEQRIGLHVVRPSGLRGWWRARKRRRALERCVESMRDAR